MLVIIIISVVTSIATYWYLDYSESKENKKKDKAKDESKDAYDDHFSDYPL